MSIKDSFDKILAMSDKEKNEFSRTANLLMSCTYIMRETDRNAVSSDYRFIEQNFELFSDYLGVIGWRIYKDSQYAIIYVKNDDGLNRRRLDGLTSVILLALRLIYEEKRTLIGTSDDIFVTVGEIVNKIVNDFPIYKKKPSFDELRHSLRTLKSHNIIYKLDESFADYECRMIIFPSVLFAVSAGKCRAICEKLSLEEGENYEKADKITAD